MDYFSGKLIKEEKPKLEKHYLEVEYEYREIAKQCAKIYLNYAARINQNH